MSFKKAVKSQAKLRAALFGPSGAGKTYTALEVATGIVSVIGGRIALIDSERSSASKYADRFEFDQVDLEKKDIDEYVQHIKEAAKENYSVLIIDSLSHAWQMLLDSVEKLAQAKYKGNTWSAWSEGTPEQRKLVDAIVSYPGHIIVTMRSKTEWQTTTNDRGKTAPVRVGLAPEQGKGIEYEFDILFEISPDHLAHIIKDRSGKFQDEIIPKPGKDFGKQLIAWLNEGKAPVAPEKPIDQQHKEALVEIGNVFKSMDEFDMPVFTEEEIADVRQKLRTEMAKMQQPEQRLAFVKKILGEQKEILRVRIEAQNPIPPKAETETTSGQTESQQTPADDHFDDDIPWDDDGKPGTGNDKKKNPPKSLKEEFEKAKQEKANANGAGTQTAETENSSASAGTNTELDIF